MHNFFFSSANFKTDKCPHSSCKQGSVSNYSNLFFLIFIACVQ